MIQAESRHQNNITLRQHGNVSFSRVFDAGHSVAAYQPEAVCQIFERAIFPQDISTRKTVSGSNYASVGPASCRNVTNELPESPKPTCYLYSAALTCSEKQIAALQNGSAVVVDSMTVSPGFEASTGKNTTEGSGTGKAPDGTVKSNAMYAVPSVLGVMGSVMGAMQLLNYL